MSTTFESSTARRRAPLGARIRAGQVILTVLLALCGVVALSTAFSDDPFPGPAIVLIASFGLLAAGLGGVVVWTIGRSQAARVAVWALPIFFVSHVAVLGTWVPDAAFAVIAAVGALLAQPGRERRAAPPATGLGQD